LSPGKEIPQEDEQVSPRERRGPIQLELPFSAAKPPKAAPAPARPSPFRVIQGGGARTQEPLASRDAVVRVLVEAGADLLLRRISAERADEIQRRVDRILRLFDHVDANPAQLPKLKAQLDELEALMGETRDQRALRRRG
jgi:hypothetical protein